MTESEGYRLICIHEANTRLVKVFSSKAGHDFGTSPFSVPSYNTFGVRLE